MNRSDQTRHAYFGNLAQTPVCAVDSLAMAAIESGAACAARVLMHRRSFEQRNAA